jgi:hypothetical protein
MRAHTHTHTRTYKHIHTSPPCMHRRRTDQALKSLPAPPSSHTPSSLTLEVSHSVNSPAPPLPRLTGPNTPQALGSSSVAREDISSGAAPASPFSPWGVPSTTLATASTAGTGAHTHACTHAHTYACTHAHTHACAHIDSLKHMHTHHS